MTDVPHDEVGERRMRGWKALLIIEDEAMIDPWLATDDEGIDAIVDSANVVLMQRLIYKLKDERDKARSTLDAHLAGRLHIVELD